MLIEVNESKHGQLAVTLPFLIILRISNLRGVKRLSTISNSKAKLLRDKGQNANNFLKNNDFSSKRLKPHIPRNFIERFGIIQNIAIHKKKTSLKYAEAEIEIKSVSRLFR